MEKVLRQPPPPANKLVPNVPKAISQLIEWTMQKDPILRPASAGDFIRELEVAMFAPDDSKRIKKLRSSQKGTMATTVIIVGVAVVVVVLVAAVWFFTK
jgi:hypothetical protein